MGSSHIYFVISDYSRTCCMTGGPQSVGKRSVLIVRLLSTIAGRSLPIGDQSLTILQVFAIPPICTDCRPPVGDWLETEAANWSWRGVWFMHQRPLHDQIVAERSYSSHRSAFFSPKVNRTVARWSATSTRLPKTTRNFAVMSGRQPVLPPV